MDVQASLFIKISKLHHFNPLMDTEQDHLTHARKTQSRAQLSVVSDDLLQRERESFISFQTSRNNMHAKTAPINAAASCCSNNQGARNQRLSMFGG
ncbi:unnamed protein product [Brassica rapa]|uniref:Uncharacterized protein n=1 Tax=Brassica campestris TaxID=3711 RepID=A0A8D9G2B9_BRACM|nr:unnamed protein product [Brassica rapa]